jgi:hypothetical protein
MIRYPKRKEPVLVALFILTDLDRIRALRLECLNDTWLGQYDRKNFGKNEAKSQGEHKAKTPRTPSSFASFRR